MSEVDRRKRGNDGRTAKRVLPRLRGWRGGGGGGADPKEILRSTRLHESLGPRGLSSFQEVPNKPRVSVSPLTRYRNLSPWWRRSVTGDVCVQREGPRGTSGPVLFLVLSYFLRLTEHPPLRHPSVNEGEQSRTPCGEPFFHKQVP